jgi:hypothetical protein
MKHLKFLLTITGILSMSLTFAQQGTAPTLQPRTGPITHKTVSPPAGQTNTSAAKTDKISAKTQTPKSKPKPGTVIYPGANTTGEAPKR